LSKADLKALSQVSKRWYPVVVQALCKSITLEPPSEYQLDRIAVAGLPQERLRLAQELHFRSGFEYANINRCPHHSDAGGSLYAEDEDEFDSASDVEDEEDGDDLRDRPLRFDSLTLSAKTVLGRLQQGQLNSFRYLSPSILMILKPRIL
jgi:hypothetical protein